MENAARQLAGHGIEFQRIEAVDGRSLPDSEIDAVYDKAANLRRMRYDLIRPEIGCYLSHVEAWRRIGGGGANAGGFVFEDDFIARDGLVDVLTMLCREERHWDMVKLYAPDRAPRTVARRPLGPKHEVVTPFKIPNHTTAYGLTREAARRLVRGALPFFRPVDEDLKYFWETGIRVGLVLPSPIGHGNEPAATGTIGAERRSVKKRGAARAWRNVAYRARYLALLHWHRMRRAP